MLTKIFATLREFLWTLIAVLAALALIVAVVFPAHFASRAAGIFDALEKVGFDIKIKTPIGEASFESVKDQQLVASDTEILGLRDALAAAQVRLAEFEGNSPFESGDIDAPIIAPLPKGFFESAPEEWVVIAGTERDLESQRDELNALKRAGVADAVILNYNGWFQTAVIYPDKAMAQSGLARVSEVVGASRGAYIRALTVVCPVWSEQAGSPDVRVCD